MNFIGCSVEITQSSNSPVCSAGWVSYTSDQLKTEIGIPGSSYLDFNPEAFSYGFGSVLTLFIAGLGVGFIVSQLRKFKP